MADALDRIQKLVPQLTLPEVSQLIEDLQRERDAKLADARAALLQEVEERSAALGLTAAELIGGRQGGRAEAKKPKSKRESTQPVQVRYRDPESGGTWTGNGRIPKWMKEAEAAGRNRAEFLLPETE